ncbi:hypothetical protein DPEC_G00258810 [Dallia pectoralis]|uniref:Uncharacterized protein n=1 Tax=Dallia pectoralis TaxID=75939 RepID=A0ACC2FQV5_DALPE|nr:hypothetical protein DPEC_G00258810 [Dallia pectoralis]
MAGGSWSPTAVYGAGGPSASLGHRGGPRFQTSGRGPQVSCGVAGVRSKGAMLGAGEGCAEPKSATGVPSSSCAASHSF